MVWFSSIKAAAAAATTTTTPTSPHSSSESPPPPAPAPPTASSTRHSRERCWAARDAFFDCLDAHGIIDSLSLKGKGKDLAAQKCRQEDIDFGKECVGSWVEYFKKRRVMEHRKEQMLKGLEKEGAVKLEAPVGAQQPK